MIDKESTYALFEAWLEEVCASEKPGSDIVAYNFGLFEGENGYMAYLIGSTEYDEEDPDRACNEDFVPKRKYFSAPERQASFLSTAQAITVGFDDGDLVKVN